MLNVEKVNTDVEARVEALLSQLTLKEKVLLLSGKDNWNTFAVAFRR
jgi:hypothetical protein